ncbi:MAG TPA: endo-1,4-beta-xylanase [Arachidicoccus sp.]|nr:endo-1,4-beta-xylanase [Arachidicoccus sp.]
MKINYRDQYLNVIFFSVFFLMLLTGCAKFETEINHLDKPQSIIDQEALNSIQDLKSFVDYNSQPNFKLGVELDYNDLINNSMLYRMMQKHFDQVSLTHKLNHVDYVHSGDSIVLNDFSQAVEANDTTGMSIFAGPLVWHKNQNAAYLNSLIADSILDGLSGSDIVEDFNNKTVGDAYPTTSDAAKGSIVADPDGKSGNALHILKNTGTAFAQIKITLPKGRTLGQYVSVGLDFRGGGCCGFYGAGMRMAISTEYGNPALTGYGGPSSFGVPDGQWGRGLIVMPMENLNLTQEQKSLTSFILTVGSQTGSPDYLIDNITMNWETPGDTIRKTPEEKKTIITGELRRWLKAVGETGKDLVKSWAVVYQPMDDDNPSKLRSGNGIDSLPANTFYWQDYLGKDYAAIAIGMIKKYSNNNDKIFITETNLVNNPAKIHGLSDFISYTESKGQKVDGIATELALDISSDTANIETMLSQLAGTGKLIKISSLDIGINASISQATAELYQKQAERYKWFVKAYDKLIPASQRAGITFRSPVDQSSSSTWRPNEPVGLWTGQNNRKQAYKGVVEGLQNK